MKPSERRALEAEKRAQKEAEQRERQLEEKGNTQRPITEQERRVDTEPVNSNAEYKKIPKESITVNGDGHHKESFFSNHVKLITFLICAVLILTVIGPWGIDRLVDSIREDTHGIDVDNKRELTVEGVKLLSDMGEDMTWDSLKNFNYIDYGSEKNAVPTHIREYPIKGTDLVLRVGGTEVGDVYEFRIPGTSIVLFRIGDTALPAFPEYVRLIDYKSGAFIEDIRKEDVTVFLYEHTITE